MTIFRALFVEPAAVETQEIMKAFVLGSKA